MPGRAEQSPLGFEVRGAGDRLILVHGFTQTRRSWRRIADTLSTARQVTAIDLPGHGTSGRAEADLPTTADLVAETGGAGTYVGYSMGGRIALHVALQHPELVSRLVLIGATPGIVGAAERAQRRAGDEALAERLERIGVDAFLEEWLAQPLFAGLTTEQADVGDRRRNTAPNLAASLRHTGTGTQTPLWDRLGDIDRPVLLLVGEHDHKFREVAQRMADSLPRADVHVATGAGHSVHLEQPDITLAVLTDWLDDHPPDAPGVDVP